MEVRSFRLLSHAGAAVLAPPHGRPQQPGCDIAAVGASA